MPSPFKTIPTALLILFMTMVTGCHNTPHADESYIHIFETDKHGQKTYYSSELFLYPDSLAIIHRLNDPFLACRVVGRTDSTATLSGIAYYPDHNSIEKNELKSTLTISVAWKGTDGIYVRSASPEFKDFKAPAYKYHKRETYYANEHVLHHNIAKTQHQINTTIPIADNASTASPDSTNIVRTPIRSTKVSATGVPICTDYSSGSSTGSLNDFHPANLIQFIDYYFGIIAFIFFLCLLILLWIGSKTDDYEDYLHNRPALMGTYTRICFVLLLLISVTEIIIFTANPYVLFESDMPLFGCLGRVFFFCSMCIGQSALIRIIRWKLHFYYGVNFIKGSWALTILSILFTVYGIYSLSVGSLAGINKTTALSLSILGVWGLSLIRLVRFIAIRHRTPITVILFYLLIYPLFIPASICGLAIGLLGKIAREKPDNEYVRDDDLDKPHYITNALGESTYVTKIGDNYWMDNNGHMYTQQGQSYFGQHDGNLYH